MSDSSSSAGAIDSAADLDRDERKLTEANERDISQTTNGMSDVQQLGSIRKRKSPPSPSVDSSAADSSLPSRAPAEAESIASAAAADESYASYWRPAGWSDMTIDFIECITSFLPLESLLIVSLVCRGWRSGIESMSPRTDCLLLAPERLLLLLASPLRRHITSLEVDRSDRADPSPLSHATVCLLRLTMPQLTRLRCAVDCLERLACGRRLRFPPQLQEAEVVLCMRAAIGSPHLTASLAWSQFERAIGDVTRVRTLTSIQIALGITWRTLNQLRSMTIPLGVLQKLTRLQDTLLVFRIAGCGVASPDSSPLTRDHVDLIRSMHRLTHLDMSTFIAWSPQELDWFTAEPMPMRLLVLGLDCTHVVDAHADSLTRLTSLAKFYPYLLDVYNPAFFTRMTQLIDVQLLCTSWVSPDRLVSSLSHCGLIERLNLVHSEMTNEHLCALLPSLSLLKSLGLMMMHSLTSLSFASAVPHLSRTLEWISISSCRSIHPAELHHLRALAGLISLKIKDTFTDPLDAHTLACMTPSSENFDLQAWPHLERFEYQSGDDESDGDEDD